MISAKPRLPLINRKHPQARGLIACFPFFERGGTVLRDVYNKKGNGTLTNFILSSGWVTQRLGAALSFTAISLHHIPIGFVNMASNQYFTIVAWVRALNGTSAADQDIFTEGNSGDDAPFIRLSIKANSDILGFTVRDDASTNNSSPVGTTALTDGLWHCLAAVRNNTIWTIYVDGKAEASTTVALSTITTNQSTIGSLRRILNIAYFNEQIAEVRLYKRVLRAKELLQITSNPWVLYTQNRNRLTLIPIQISQRITEVLKEVKYNILELDYGISQTVTPYGKYLKIQLATEVPISPPAPGGKGIVFFINASNNLKIYCWDGTAWRVN